jgi:hypothetical protein
MKTFIRILMFAAMNLAGTVMFFSCSTDDPVGNPANNLAENPVEEKTSNENISYSGTFTTTYYPWSEDGTRKPLTVIRTVTLTLKDGRFVCLDNAENDYSSANGSGVYSVQRGKIIFQDECGRITLLSWDWILNGEYDYALDKGRLKLSKESYGTVYKYDLIQEQ